MARKPIRYGLFVEMPRSAISAAIENGLRLPIAALGDLTDENLNWMTEFRSDEGWHQQKLGGRGDRAVVMSITNDNDD